MKILISFLFALIALTASAHAEAPSTEDTPVFGRFGQYTVMKIQDPNEPDFCSLSDDTAPVDFQLIYWPKTGALGATFYISKKHKYPEKSIIELRMKFESADGLTPMLLDVNGVTHTDEDNDNYRPISAIFPNSDLFAELFGNCSGGWQKMVAR